MRSRSSIESVFVSGIGTLDVFSTLKMQRLNSII